MKLKILDNLYRIQKILLILLLFSRFFKNEKRKGFCCIFHFFLKNFLPPFGLYAEKSFSCNQKLFFWKVFYLSRWNIKKLPPVSLSEKTRSSSFFLTVKQQCSFKISNSEGLPRYPGVSQLLPVIFVVIQHGGFGIVISGGGSNFTGAFGSVAAGAFRCL